MRTHEIQELLKRPVNEVEFTLLRRHNLARSMRTWLIMGDIAAVRTQIYAYGDDFLKLDAGPYFDVFVTICRWVLAAQEFEERHGVGSLLDLSHSHVDHCRRGGNHSYTPDALINAAAFEVERRQFFNELAAA